jgi:hypothetical protein
MADGDVHLLDPGCAAGGHHNGQFGGRGYRAALTAAQSQGFESQLPGHFQGFHHIGGVAAGAETQGYIPRASQGPDLLDEHLQEVVIVGDTGKDGGVRGEGGARSGSD